MQYGELHFLSLVVPKNCQVLSTCECQAVIVVICISGIIGHALVEFNEREQNNTSVVPTRMTKWTKPTKPKEGEEIIVCCDGEEYLATFCYSGKFYF